MRKKVSNIGFLAVIIALMMVVGLGVVIAAGQENYANKTVVIAVNISPKEVTLNVTGTQQFTATAFEQDNKSIPATFSWNVSNSTVGNVSETGLFTASCPGTTFVNATADNVTGTATVTVAAISKRFAIPTWLMPWILWAVVVAIIAVSFLIFFRLEKTKIKFPYDLIIWLGYCIIVPLILFCLKIFGFSIFLFALVIAISLPILFAIIRDIIIEKKEAPLAGFGNYFKISFEVFDKGSKLPIRNVKISVSKFGSNVSTFDGPTDPFGSYECKLERGKYEYKIEPLGEYKPKSGSFSVERDESIPIPLSKRTGSLTVQVKEIETGNPVQKAKVSVNRMEKTTDEQGKAFFADVPIGVKEIKVDETKGVYSSGTTQCEIKEDAANEVSISLKSLLRIPLDKESKLHALRNNLQDNYRRVSTYDPCIPFYYKSIVDNVVNLIIATVSKPMLFVGSKNNPNEIIGHLIDVIDLASHEVIGVMTSKRNVDVYSAAMRLEKAEVGAKPVNFDDSRVVDYIRDAEDFYNSYYHTVQSKLFEIDTNLTRKTGEMNVLPVSGIWRIARMLLNETSTSTSETASVKKGAMTLVASILLDYAEGMLNDPKIIERLKIMVI
jgi:hypothetical protein